MKPTIFKLVFSALLLAGTASIASAQTQREFFDKKGRHLYTIAYYGEKGLPAEVRAIVKPVYYDYAILTVEEVKVSGRSIYFIDMEDSSTIKTVRIADGEMELVRTQNRTAADDRTQARATALQSQHGL